MLATGALMMACRELVSVSVDKPDVLLGQEEEYTFAAVPMCAMNHSFDARLTDALSCSSGGRQKVWRHGCEWTSSAVVWSSYTRDAAGERPSWWYSVQSSFVLLPAAMGLGCLVVLGVCVAHGCRRRRRALLPLSSSWSSSVSCQRAWAGWHIGVTVVCGLVFVAIVHSWKRTREIERCVPPGYRRGFGTTDDDPGFYDCEIWVAGSPQTLSWALEAARWCTNVHVVGPNRPRTIHIFNKTESHEKKVQQAQLEAGAPSFNPSEGTVNNSFFLQTPVSFS